MVKACLSCRKRKQKCDQNKPQCHQCRIRNIECIYTDTKIDNNACSVPKPTKESGALSNEDSINEERSEEKANPLRGVKYLFRKNDRWVACGVTSMRTIFHLHLDSKFNRYFLTAWNKLKEERNAWKEENNYSSLREWTLLGDSNIIKNGESLIDAVCRVLPSFEEIENHLETYFNGSMHQTFQIVDPKKVMNDLRSYFIKGAPISEGSHHSVVSLIPSATQNILCVGVIIEILRATYYATVPREVEFFSGYLTSSASMKGFGIEKLQCVMLKACNLDFTAFTGGDFSRIYLLVQMACSLAIDLGLNDDVEIPTNTSQKCYVDNLYTWVLYMDLQVSFNMGTPLQIREIDSKKLQRSLNESTQAEIFKRSILMLRRTMEKVYAERSVPKIKQHISEIKDFINTNFRPLSFYMIPENYHFNESIEIHSLLFLLTVISNLSNIQRYYFFEETPETFNTTIQASFNSLHISVTILRSYFAMDMKESKCDSKMNPISQCLPKHLQVAAWATYHTMGRVIYEIYGLLFSTLQNSVPVPFDINERPITNFEIGSLNVCTEHTVSLKVISQMLNSIFDTIYSDASRPLLSTLKRSYCFLFVLSLEAISRIIFSNGIMVKEASNSTDEAEKANPSGGDSLLLREQNAERLKDVFWNQYDSSMSNWLDNDLELCFAEWFGKFVDLPT